MLTYIVPQFNQLFVKMNAEVPIQTRFLLAVSLFLKANWWTIPLTLGGTFFGDAGIFEQAAGQNDFLPKLC